VTLSRHAHELEDSLGMPLPFAQTGLGGLAAAFRAAFPGVLLEVASGLPPTISTRPFGR